MSDRRVITPPQSTQIMVRDRLTHPATVFHPTVDGEIRRFEVTIERVFWRTDEEGTFLAFRGKATIDDWSGYKTFFADKCTDVVDGTTNAPIADVRFYFGGSWRGRVRELWLGC